VEDREDVKLWAAFSNAELIAANTEKVDDDDDDVDDDSSRVDATKSLGRLLVIRPWYSSGRCKWLRFRWRLRNTGP
jgi:hypothetical protein